MSEIIDYLQILDLLDETDAECIEDYIMVLKAKDELISQRLVIPSSGYPNVFKAVYRILTRATYLKKYRGFLVNVAIIEEKFYQLLESYY